MQETAIFVLFVSQQLPLNESATFSAVPQKVYTETPKKSAQVFYWKIKILYLPTRSFWSKRVKL